MKPQITERQEWVEIDEGAGKEYWRLSHYAPVRCIGDRVQYLTGYGARLSVPGSSDCTKWRVFNTEQEAARYLINIHDNNLEWVWVYELADLGVNK